MIRVQAWNKLVSPKFYGPLAIWPWLKISPHSSLNVIYCLITTAWQWLTALCIRPVFLCKLNPIQAHWGTGSWSFPFERSATFPPQADHVLVDLFSSVVAGGGGPCQRNTPPTIHSQNILSTLLFISKHLINKTLREKPVGNVCW